MTLQEILHHYGYSKMPAGTTEKQWLSFHEEMTQYVKVHGEKLKNKEITDMAYFCDMPNVPGYYRANND